MKLNRKLLTEVVFTVGVALALWGLWDIWRPLGLMGTGLSVAIVAVLKCKPG